jgi:putative ABC transport system ATP-binding protein
VVADALQVAGREYFAARGIRPNADVRASLTHDAGASDRRETDVSAPASVRAAEILEVPRITGTPIVEARGVRKTYDTGSVHVNALRGIDLALAQGEMVAIMGPSGCGKTTLLNCLSGLDSVDDGEVLIDGTPLSDMSDRARTDYRARRMGFVFQFYNLMPVLTAVENVELPLLVARVDTNEARKRALAALDLVGLADRANHVPDALSGGERQRATIARSLVNDPAIVWADEPTGDLDSENATEIVELMRRLNLERGLSFLIVTHDIAVGRSTDRIVRMVDGAIRGEELLGVR